MVEHPEHLLGQWLVEHPEHYYTRSRPGVLPTICLYARAEYDDGPRCLAEHSAFTFDEAIMGALRKVLGA
jgi:hypothetical protein